MQVNEAVLIAYPRLRQGHTHFVWSNSAGSLAVAARYLDCTVVSPLWVEECIRARQRVAEEPYAVDVDHEAQMISSKSRRLKEPELKQTSSVPARGIRLSKAVDSLKRTSIGSAVNEIDDTAPKTKAPPSIPLPSFRVIAPEPVILEQGVRRSVRIIDSDSPLSTRGPRATVQEDMGFVGDIRPDTVFRVVSDVADLDEERAEGVKRPLMRSAVAESNRPTETGADDAMRKRSKSNNERQAAAVVGDRKGKDAIEAEVEALESGRGKRRRPPTRSEASNTVISTKPNVSETSTVAKSPVSASISSVGTSQGAAIILSGFASEEAQLLESLVDAINITGLGPLLRIETDPSAELDLVVAEQRKRQLRTVKVLFALVRGLPVVTKDWLYRSLDGRADPLDFRHPRYSAHELGRPLAYLVDERVFVSPACDPAPTLCLKMVRDLGGSEAGDVCDATIVFAGDVGTDVEAVEALLRTTTASRKAVCMEALVKLAAQTKLLRLKVLLRLAPSEELTVNYHYV
jgi:hypothetical protein